MTNRYTPRMRAKTAKYHDLTRPWQWDVGDINKIHFILREVQHVC